MAKWDQPKVPVRDTLQTNRAATESMPDSIDRSGMNNNPTKSLSSATDMSLLRRTSVSDRLRAEFLVDGSDEKAKDSHTARLKQILEEPALRSLFREFLRANFCEENLSFWLDVQDFKRRFNTSSSAAAAPGALPTQRGQGLQAMERHQQDLISMAFVIYNSELSTQPTQLTPAYLAPASPCELNIDHQLRGELISYMNEILEDKNADKAEILPGVGNSLHASQLQNMVFLYERIQTHIFRLMATDSVPKVSPTRPTRLTPVRQDRAFPQPHALRVPVQRGRRRVCAGRGGGDQRKGRRQGAGHKPGLPYCFQCEHLPTPQEHRSHRRPPTRSTWPAQACNRRVYSLCLNTVTVTVPSTRLSVCRRPAPVQRQRAARQYNTWPHRHRARADLRRVF